MKLGEHADNARIVEALRSEYGLSIVRLEPLRLGEDPDSAVFRADTDDGVSHFAKFRRGFSEASVTVPRLLGDQGIEAVIAPTRTRAGALWTAVGDRTLVLYPYVVGRSALEVPLTERHWLELGRAVKHLHALEPVASVPRESYSGTWRGIARDFVERKAPVLADDAAARELGALFEEKGREILDLIDRTEQLGAALAARSPALVLCHSDLHAGNILIGEDGRLHIVDWDSPILAAVERDLMFAGGAQGFLGRTPQEEEQLFFHGYGPAQVDPVALAYYRCERIIDDFAVNARQLLSTSEGGEPRRLRWVGYVRANFLSGGTIERALSSPAAA